MGRRPVSADNMEEGSEERKALSVLDAEGLPATTAELAAYFITGRRRLREANQAAPAGWKTCRALADLTDAVIRQLFDLATGRSGGATAERIRGQIAVLATGSY